MSEKTRVLFLCTGNSARSQMAEALLTKLADDKFDVFSAGLEPKDVHPMTIRALDEIGIDWSKARSKTLTEYLGKIHFGYLITVCSRAEEKCPVFPGMGQRLHWPFDDPAAVQGSEEEQLAAFRTVRDQIEVKIMAWLQNQGIFQS
jgi:arsenate reductase